MDLLIGICSLIMVGSLTLLLVCGMICMCIVMIKEIL